MTDEISTQLNKKYNQNEDINKKIQELEIQILNINAQLIQRDNQLSQIYMSKEWKLAQLFRRIGSFLAPTGSYQKQMVQLVLSAIMGNDYIWDLLFVSQKKLKRSKQISSNLKNQKTKDTKPKIGYVVSGTAISGGLAVVCEHANRLLQRGYDVSIITEDNLDRIAWFPNQIAPVIPIEKNAVDDCDILIATGWTTAYTVQKLEAPRKFYFIQSDESRFYPPGDFRAKRARKTYEMNLEFITMAQWLKDWLENQFGRIATYIPNGINEKIIFPDKPLEKKSDKVRILLEGAINAPFKGMEDAFMAVNDLDCEVWCVSASGTPKPEWKCDKFFSQIPFGEMRHIYSSCDILLKMSRVESFCYPPLEMMTCGGTAVIGQVTGIEEYAIDGYNALIVPSGDVKAAHNALKKLIYNKELRSRLSENGKKTAEKFRWDASIDKLEKLFSEKPRE